MLDWPFHWLAGAILTLSLLTLHMLSWPRKLVTLIHDGTVPTELECVLEALAVVADADCLDLISSLRERVEAAALHRLHLWCTCLLLAPVLIHFDLQADPFGPSLVAGADVASMFSSQPPKLRVITVLPSACPLGGRAWGPTFGIRGTPFRGAPLLGPQGRLYVESGSGSSSVGSRHYGAASRVSSSG